MHSRKLLTQPPPIKNTRPNKRARLTTTTRDEVSKPDAVPSESTEPSTTTMGPINNTTAASTPVDKRRRVKVPKEKKSDEPAVPCSAVLSGRQCKSRAQHGAQYCWRHLPLDPNSEWAWCAHTDSNGKQCSNPVLKNKVTLPYLVSGTLGLTVLFSRANSANFTPRPRPRAQVRRVTPVCQVPRRD